MKTAVKQVFHDRWENRLGGRRKNHADHSDRERFPIGLDKAQKA
jgi:hypothetical protein